MNSLAGKVAWLTGASSGIGESLAYALSTAGATLILTARRERELERVQSQCARSSEHYCLPLDLLRPDNFATAANSVLGRFGHVDVLLHCAGISQRGTVVETQMNVDRHIMEVNYFAPVALTRLLLPSMIERRSGHIVGICSVLGKFGVPRRSSYCASKHALIGFLDALRSEVHDCGVRVSVICPGFVRTNASYNALKSDGSPHGTLDDDIRDGISSDECAQRIVRAIERGARESYIGRERWGVYLNRFLPGLFSKLVRNRHLK